MNRILFPLLLLSVYSFLAIAIYVTAIVIPEYVETKKSKLEQNNFFLNGEKDIISNENKLIIAKNCKIFLDKLENDFRIELTELSLSAYKEYKALKAKNPDISPYSLAGKYIKKLRHLEESYDSKFNKYTETMAKELKANSFSLELVDQARYAYSIRKKQIKENLYQKAKYFIDTNDPSFFSPSSTGYDFFVARYSR